MNDNHKKHTTAHAAIMAGRQRGKSVLGYQILIQEWSDKYIGTIKKAMTAEEWVIWGNVNEDDVLAYPNARTAYEIHNSPLAKALK